MYEMHMAVDNLFLP